MEDPGFISLLPFELSPPVPPPPPYFLPDQVQLSEIKPKISENDATLKLLQRQVSWLDGTVKKARRRIKEYESYNRLLRRHAMLHGPTTIKDLPPEILSVIFEFCCEDVAFQSSRLYPFAFDRSPWILSWVCSSWRTISLSSPELWTILPGPLDFTRSYISNEHLNILDTTLQRCHHSQLKAFFYVGEQPFGKCLPSLGDIARHLNRIQELRFLCHGAEGMRRLFDLPEFPVPDDGLASLKSLTFDLERVYSPRDAPFIMQGTGLPPLFQKMPNLKKMAIVSPDRLVTEAQFWELSFPWKQLTSIDVRNTSLAVVCGIMRSAVQLQELKVSDLSPLLPGMPPISTRKTVHPNLSLLYIHCRFVARLYSNQLGQSDDWPETLFDIFDLPKLEKLSIGHQRCIQSATITNFVERSQCALSELALSPAVDSMISVLQCLTTIKRLVIRGPFHDNDLGLFCHPVEGQWLLPRLTTLVLRSSYISNPDALIDTIGARKSEGSVQNIESIEISIPIRALADTDPLDDISSSSSRFGISYPDDEIYLFSERCRRYTTGLLRASCGYELINSTPMDLERLCDEIESFQYDAIAHSHILEWSGLLSPLFRICKYLSEVGDTENPSAIALEYKRRLQKVLRVWTHDPWLFETPPIGWSRALDSTLDLELPESEFSKRELLTYRAV